MMPALLGAMQQSGGPLHFSDFNGATDTLLANYTPDVGNPFSAIEGNYFRLDGSGGCKVTNFPGNPRALTDVGVDNYKITANCLTDASAAIGVGLAFRGTDVNNLLICFCNSGGIYIQKYVSGVRSAITSTAAITLPTSGTPFSISVSVVGQTATVAINGVDYLVHDFSVHGFASGSLVGIAPVIYISSGRWYDLTVEAL